MLRAGRIWMGVLAVGGVLAAAAVGWVVQSAAGERVALSGASKSAGYSLAPDGAAASKAMGAASNEHPIVAQVGPDGKVKIISGKVSESRGSSYVAHNAGAAKWDD